MFRKDASLATFVEAITYEKDLWSKKSAKKVKVSKFDFRQQAVKRRIIHLYQRACRKYKHNLPLAKEYVHFLFQAKAGQKLGRVISELMQMHPQVVDFWLVAAYNEMEIKGNLFAGRKLLLQGLRNNENSVLLHVEYLRFEIELMRKLKERRQVLTGGLDKKLDFVDMEQQKVEEKEGEDNNELIEASNQIIKIAFDSVTKKFPGKLRLFAHIWKDLVKKSSCSDDFKQHVNKQYDGKKTESLEMFEQYIGTKEPSDKLLQKLLERNKFGEDGLTMITQKLC